MKKLKIAVLCGGFSSERVISLKTGKAVYEGLTKWNDFDVQIVDIKKDKCLEQILNLKKQKIDVVFIALHGKFGEDGKIQSILESAGIRYTGAGVTASFIAMYKHLTKLLLKHYGILTPRWHLLKSKSDIETIDIEFSPPYVIKPVDSGSTIGMSIVKSFNKLEIKKAVEFAFKYSDGVIIEEYIKGKEITVPILDNNVLPIVEIVPKLNQYYDFKSKYKPKGSLHLIPPNIDKKLYKKIEFIAKKVANLIGCEMLCRIDMIIDAKNRPYVLEVNSIPGMTSVSLLPESAKSCGISFEELVRKIVLLSFKYK